MTGGYQILTLESKDFKLGTPMIEKGIYDKIEGTLKPLLITDIVIAGKEYHNTFVEFSVSDSNFVGTIYGYEIKVENTDAVTISNKA